MMKFILKVGNDNSGVSYIYPEGNKKWKQS